MIGFSFCSKKYHPIKDFIAERVEGLPELKYYHTDIHKAAFVLPAFTRNIF